MTSSTHRTLAQVLDRTILRRLAGARAFARGEQYLAAGRVLALVGHGGIVAARVLGTREYRVQLSVARGGFAGSCDCPVGAEAEFCKHCVAAGLAWLAGTRSAEGQSGGAEGQGGDAEDLGGGANDLGGGGQGHAADAEEHGSKAPMPGWLSPPPRGSRPRARRRKEPGATMADVRPHLAGQSKATLVDLLLDHAKEDARLRERLLLRTAKAGGKALDLAPFHAAIDAAVETRGYVRYAEALDFASGIEEAIEPLERLVKEGHVGSAIELAEHALVAVEGAIGSVDDSAGYMLPLLHRLEGIHHAACKQAKPDPEALARRLFEWGLGSEWETFSDAAATYAGVLGPKGLATYRALAEAVWARVPVLGPAIHTRERFSGRRFRITHIMETLARHARDVEALVEVKRRDLSSAYAYVEIAEAYRKARKHDLALDWAERGLKAFPHRTDSRLREVLALEYHRRGRHDEALTLAWSSFTDAPGLDAYRSLKAHADKVGRWWAWREKALTHLREAIATAQSPVAQIPGIRPDVAEAWWHRSRFADRSDLVQIHLWEKDVDPALREAREGGCSDEMWMKLAAWLEKNRPADAIPIYQARIEPTLARKNKPAYREAVRLLDTIRRLMDRSGRGDEFAAYLAAIREKHKLKTNFTGLLDGKDTRGRFRRGTLGHG